MWICPAARPCGLVEMVADKDPAAFVYTVVLFYLIIIGTAVIYRIRQT